MEGKGVLWVRGSHRLSSALFQEGKREEKGVLCVTGSHTSIICSISGRKGDVEGGIVGNRRSYGHHLLYFREEGGSGRGYCG